MRLIRQIQAFQDGGYMSLSIPERKKYITNRLIQLGYTPVQTVAIVGNLQQENHKFDPTIKNSIGATGIAQWLSKGRKDVLLQKNNPYSIDTQLEFLHEEIQGKTKDAWTNKVGGKDAFMNAKTVEEATLIFRKDFERPGEHEAYDNKRTKYASETMSLIDPNYQPPQFVNQTEQGIAPNSTPTPTLDELNRISPADIWEMYKDEPSKAAELIAFKNEYEERLQKEAQAEKQAEVDLQKQALAQAQAEKQMVQSLLTTPTAPQEDYNTQISQPQQPTQPFRFQTDWYIPQMAQRGGTISPLQKIKQKFHTDWYVPQMAQKGGEVIYDEELSNLPEVTISNKVPEWIQYRREFEENNPMGSYIHDNRSMWANRQYLIDRYEKETNQYIYDQLLKNNPRRSEESRGEYIQRITGDNISVQDIIEQNKNRDSSTSENVYMNFARGYLGLSYNPFSKAAKTAIETKAYAPHEREQITNSPLENIGNMADILSVPYNATVGTLYTRGQGQDNYNMASGLSGQVPENRNAWLEVGADPLNLVGVGAVPKASGTGKAIQQFGKYATNNTPLRNAYKLNPYAFKPNPEAYYRVLGKEGVNDALESGIIRANPKNIDSFSGTPIYDRPFFSKGVPFDRDWKSPFKNKKGKQVVGSIYPDETMVEVFGHDKFHKTGDLVTSPIDVLNSSDEGIKFYKRDWLKGYKEVPKNKVLNKTDDVIPKKQWYDNFHLGELSNELPINYKGDFIERGVTTESALNDFFNTGIIRNNKSAGLPLNKRSSNYGERVFFGPSSESSILPRNNYTFKVRYSDELKNRPVTFNDVEDIIIKNADGTYSSMPNWKDKFKNHPNYKTGAALLNSQYQQGGTISPLSRIKQKFQ